MNRLYSNLAALVFKISSGALTTSAALPIRLSISAIATAVFSLLRGRVVDVCRVTPKPPG